MTDDSLGDRMKTYEDIFRNYLPGRLPVIIRVDGKAFHTMTREMRAREEL
jgi:tRNA(His) 5'-end guanylyltransferase